MRYLIKVAYDGSKFYGFQRLNNKPSVQKELERVLSIINNEKVIVKGAGRTDAGVHALNQGVSFLLNKDFECNKLKKILNSLLSDYIVVNECFKVDKDFHARFSVLEKTYEYHIYKGVKNPFWRDYALFYNYELDIAKMRKGASVFVGKHCFRNFVSGKRDNYDCIINDIEIKEEDNKIVLVFRGASFYRYMVRSLAGALLLLGRNKISLNDIKKALDEPNIKKEFWVAPASGLYLTDVNYKL